MDKYYLKFNSTIGEFTLVQSSDNFITNVSITSIDVSGLTLKETELLIQAKTEICEYLKGLRKEFTVPFKQETTPFQKKVYDVLAEIPYGYKLTYSDIAYLIGKEGGSRAVGNALGRNNILLLVPCHRVVGKTSLGGFSSGLKVKEQLLKLEKSLEL
ncbi:MAG: methylated-DNA--[protein]-cysteine S-methyltransferase [Acholeplasmataceae bacterium]|jgi:O-6-methylguanine DNA methyltransferase|nr:methylated-DNA--[protein]-cysteine S-methyltransferase [Acholeplasmataceae bacterium]